MQCCASARRDCSSLQHQLQRFSSMWEIPSSACLGGTEGKWVCLLTAYSSRSADPVVVRATAVESVLAGEHSAPRISGDRRWPSSFLLSQFSETVAGQGDQLWVLPGYWGEQVWMMAQTKGNESIHLMFSGWERNIWNGHGFFFLWRRHHRCYRVRCKTFLGIFVKPMAPHHLWSSSWD